MGIYIPGLKGNATVPGDAPIQPPQALVDTLKSATLWSDAISGTFNGANKGTTSFDGTYAGTIAQLLLGVFGVGFTINLSGNSLSSAAVNAVLAGIVAVDIESPNTLDLSGSNMGAPTGQGIIDKVTLIGFGWTVPTS